jgi:hypothetical protein
MRNEIPEDGVCFRSELAILEAVIKVYSMGILVPMPILLRLRDHKRTARGQNS